MPGSHRGGAVRPENASLHRAKAGEGASAPATDSIAAPSENTFPGRRKAEKNIAPAAKTLLRGRKTERVFGRGGIAMARFVCRLPEESLPPDFPAGGQAVWDAFLARVTAFAEETATLCRTELLPRMQAAYDADPDPKKRFRFKGAFVTLTCDIVQEKEGVFAVLWHFTVGGAGNATTDKTFREHLFATLRSPSAKSGRRRKNALAAEP